jgi:hypothetical protein
VADYCGNGRKEDGLSIAKCEQHGYGVIVVWDDTPNRAGKYKRCPMCEMEDRMESAQFEVEQLRMEKEEAKK